MENVGPIVILRGRKPIFKSGVWLIQKWSILFDGGQTSVYSKEFEGPSQLWLTKSKQRLKQKHKKIGMTAGIFIEIWEYDYTIIQA